MMSTETATTYTVTTAELVRRTYFVTTAGGEARAAELAAGDDYGLTTGETVEHLEGQDEVVDVSVVEIGRTAEGVRP